MESTTSAVLLIREEEICKSVHTIMLANLLFCLKDPKFSPNQLIVPENMKERVQSTVYKTLIQQEFSVTI